MWLNDIDKLSTLFSNSFWSFLFCLFYVGFRNGNAISPYIVNIGYHLIGGGVNVSLTKKKTILFGVYVHWWHCTFWIPFEWMQLQNHVFGCFQQCWVLRSDILLQKKAHQKPKHPTEEVYTFIWVHVCMCVDVDVCIWKRFSRNVTFSVVLLKVNCLSEALLCHSQEM